MPAKVVGYDRAAVSRRVTCRNCAAINEYLKGDVKEHRVTDYTGGYDTEYIITCGGCGKLIDIKAWY